MIENVHANAAYRRKFPVMAARRALDGALAGTWGEASTRDQTSGP